MDKELKMNPGPQKEPFFHPLEDR